MGARRRVRIASTAVAGVLGLTGAAFLTTGLVDRHGSLPPASEIPSRSSPSAGASATVSHPSGRMPAAGSTSAGRTRPEQGQGSRDSSSPKLGPPTLPESVPVRITIPAIGVDNSNFVDLGLQPTGEMEAPKNPADVGWFTGGHTPGSPGVGVIAGHVTWNGAPASFFKLGRLRRADPITIRREDGSSATFEVTRRSTFLKNDFPTEQVYRAAAEPELVLITCGGAFDADRRYYDSNVIVWAKLVSTSR